MQVENPFETAGDIGIFSNDRHTRQTIPAVIDR
jgi:hypothetical protein